MKIYLDTCCWGRPQDDQSHDRIRAEAGAVLHITKTAKSSGHTVYGSLALDEEINANLDEETRAKTLALYRRTVTARAVYVEEVFNHFEPLALRAGIRRYDAYHLCYSISAGADYLLTTDTKFLGAAAGMTLPVIVINPLTFNAGGVT